MLCGIKIYIYIFIKFFIRFVLYFYDSVVFRMICYNIQSSVDRLEYFMLENLENPENLVTLIELILK